ncbi:MAG: OmpA family protein [Pseudomonadota bacterium]
MRQLLALLVLCTPAFAADLPPEFDLRAPENGVQTAHSDRAYDSYPLPIAAFGGEQDAVEELRGRVIWSAYRVDGEVTSAALIDAYRARLSEDGFAALFECETRECGGFDFNFEAALLPAPGMLIDVDDFRQLTMRRESDGAHASILVSRVLQAAYVQTVLVVEAEPDVTLVPSGGVNTAPETVILPRDEKMLFDRLIAAGSIEIEGLVFEPGGAILSDGSEEGLDLLARLLNRNPIDVVIVGHSDNQGDLETNRALSLERAQSVIAALEQRGVVASQMSAEGLGFLAPIATNATEEGRAMNRRVDLVLKSLP